MVRIWGFVSQSNTCWCSTQPRRRYRAEVPCGSDGFRNWVVRISSSGLLWRFGGWPRTGIHLKERKKRWQSWIKPLDRTEISASDSGRSGTMHLTNSCPGRWDVASMEFSDRTYQSGRCSRMLSWYCQLRARFRSVVAQFRWIRVQHKNRNLKQSVSAWNSVSDFHLSNVRVVC